MNQFIEASDILTTTVQRLAKCRHLTDIMSIVSKSCRAMLGADGATFVVREQDLCHYVDEDSIAPLWKGQKFSQNLCIGGWAMLHNQQVIIEDADIDKRIPHEAYLKTFVKSLLMTPVGRSHPQACIGAYWAKRHLATPRECKKIQALADATAVAIENIKLLDSLESRVKELDAANKSKDEFLMTLSHELRTPLNAVLGWTDLMLSSTFDKTMTKTALETVLRNAEQQARLIDELLDMTRVSTGRFELDMAFIDLPALLKGVVDSAAPAAAAKGVTLELAGYLPVGRMTGDLGRLQQALSNLIINSIKFSGTGGKVRIELKREGPHAVITVMDTGEGIDPTFLPFVFAAFRQADSSIRRKHGGLGLGLAIVKHIVEAHGGLITAASPGLGQGATFTMRLVLSDLPASDARRNGSELNLTQPLKGVTVLVVDDEEDVRALLRAILAQQGAQVVTVTNANDGLLALARDRPDIVISDLSMPGQDGCSMMQGIRRGSVQTKVPAIALTAFADREHERQAFAAGFDAFIGKPMQPKKLLQKIMTCLGR